MMQLKSKYSIMPLIRTSTFNQHYHEASVDICFLLSEIFYL